MPFNKSVSQIGRLNNNLYCAGGRFYDSTNNIHDDIHINNAKMFRGKCSKGRNKSMMVSDELIKAEIRFFLNVGQAAVSFGKKVANNPVSEIEIATKIGTSKGTKHPAKVIINT